MSDRRGVSLSNWGRWGASNQRGTFNLISAESVKAAATLIRTGKTYNDFDAREHVTAAGKESLRIEIRAV